MLMQMLTLDVDVVQACDGSMQSKSVQQNSLVVPSHDAHLHAGYQHQCLHCRLMSHQTERSAGSGQGWCPG